MRRSRALSFAGRSGGGSAPARRVSQAVPSTTRTPWRARAANRLPPACLDWHVGCCAQTVAPRVFWVFVGAALVGCSSGADGAGGAPDAGGRPPVVEADEPKVEEEDPASYELELPAAGTLPLGANDVLRVSDTADIDFTSTWHVAEDGAITAVFDRADIAFSRSEIYRVRSRDGRRFTKPERMPVGTKPASLVGGPSLASSGGMYFLSAAALQARPKISFMPKGSVEPETVSSIPGVDGMLSWPRFRSLAEGGVGVAFRDGRSVPHFARSADGKTFDPPVIVRDAGGAMADVAEMKDGTLAFTYQQESTVDAMVSYVVLSHDGGKTWSEPIRVSDEANVHDTSAVARADGHGVDLYFIHPGGNHGFSLYRRSLGTNGELGSEERVTRPNLGEPSKPSAARRADGTVIVGWSEIAERSEIDRTPSVQRLVIAEIATDAPR